MHIIKVITGFGYFTDVDGNIVGKATLPIGSHPLQDEFRYVEVADRTALDAVKEYVKPISVEQKEEAEKEVLIQAKLREIAEAELIIDGKLNIEGKVAIK